MEVPAETLIPIPNPKNQKQIYAIFQNSRVYCVVFPDEENNVARKAQECVELKVPMLYLVCQFEEWKDAEDFVVRKNKENA